MVAIHASYRMRDDLCNNTWWKHKWEVAQSWKRLDTIATDWASKEDWMSNKRTCAFADKTKFDTVALDGVKLSTVHWKEREKRKEKVNGTTPRDLGPTDTTIHTHVKEGCFRFGNGRSEILSRRLTIT